MPGTSLDLFHLSFSHQGRTHMGNIPKRSRKPNRMGLSLALRTEMALLPPLHWPTGFPEDDPHSLVSQRSLAALSLCPQDLTLVKWQADTGGVRFPRKR